MPEKILYSLLSVNLGIILSLILLWDRNKITKKNTIIRIIVGNIFGFLMWNILNNFESLVSYVRMLVFFSCGLGGINIAKVFNNILSKQNLLFLIKRYFLSENKKLENNDD